jgi:hypothetical protein
MEELKNAIEKLSDTKREIDWKQEWKKTWRRIIHSPKKCLVCGKPLDKPTGITITKYCSKECRKKRHD